MASSHRKLNTKQLVTLSEVYWDDAAKLAEILEELRSRLEPEAEALARTLTGRVHLLRTNPAAAREQPPPTQREETDEAAAPAPAPATPRSRRRAAAVVAVLAAAVVAAWLLWPRSAPPPIAVQPASGPEVALGGLQANEPPKSPAEQILPPAGAPRRAARDRPDLQARSEAGGGGGAGSGGSGGAAADGSASRRPLAKPRTSEKEAPEPAEIAERDPARDAREPDAAQPPPRGAARSGAAGRSAAGASASRASAAGAAETGIAIGDAQLTCYRTDSRPESCGALPDAAAASAAEPRATPERDASSPAAGSGAGAGAGGAPAPSSPSVSPPPVARPAALPARGSPAGPAAGAAPAGGGGGGAAGGGGGGGGSGGGASPPAGSAASPARTASPATPIDPDAVAAAAASLPACPPAPESGRVVFILDGSVSMGLPLDVDADLEDALDDGVRRHDPKARQEYRALLAEPGPKRITRARDAFDAAAADLPPKVELGLVVFQECRDIRKIGVFDAARRGKAVDYIRALIPRGRTPIAASLRVAAEMLGPGASSIVLLTDGREFCDGDPCAAAAEIKAAHPHTPVSIVDITGENKSECVAEITGGHSYKPDAADDLARVVSAAFRGADPLCGAETEPDAQAGPSAQPPSSQR